MRRACGIVSIGVTLLAVFAGYAEATNVDLTSGTTGTNTPVPQSFNETRGVDVTVLGTANHSICYMTLRGLYISTASGTVGARVYDSSSQALIASANMTVSGGSNLTVTLAIPVTTLVAGKTYRLSFFVSAGVNGGSGTMFDPNPAGPGGFPYIESMGTLRVVEAYSTGSDAFPNSQNIYVPLMSALLDCTSPIPATTPLSLALLSSLLLGGGTWFMVNRRRMHLK